jgi:hypothetical protein
LYDRKADPKHRTALHVFIDEADAFVPQRLVPGTERCFGAVDTLVRRGRSSGLAPTLISQRPQVINKDVLSQTEVLVSHQLTGPQDRKALQTWIEANDTDNQGGTFMASLASLEKGQAWFWSPGCCACSCASRCATGTRSTARRRRRPASWRWPARRRSRPSTWTR